MVKGKPASRDPTRPTRKPAELEEPWQKHRGNCDVLRATRLQILRRPVGSVLRTDRPAVVRGQISILSRRAMRELRSDPKGGREN
jgi:hypothetical protein